MKEYYRTIRYTIKEPVKAILALGIAALVVLPINGLRQTASAQPLLEAWGNLEGIRLEGQLMKLNSTLRVVGDDWSDYLETAKEQQEPEYNRDGNSQIINSKLGTVSFRQVITDTGKGRVDARIRFTAQKDTSIRGAYMHLALPSQYYSKGSAEFGGNEEARSLSENNLGGDKVLQQTASQIYFDAPQRQLSIKADRPTRWRLARNDEGHIEVYITVLGADGEVEEGASSELNLSFEVDGDIDRRPITLAVDTSDPGRQFDGLGGNFRLQNPEDDPKVINYNLNNLRVAWGRVELPWRQWHPDEDVDPFKAAENGNIDPHVENSMEMAKQLSKRGMPVVLGDWSAPDWAIVGERTRGPGPDGKRGNRLKPDKMEKIYDSITKYVLYLKKHYGVEAEMFSFNESDLGIDVRQTPEEHARLNKELGEHFAEHGLKTKMVLGDASDANGYDFIKPSMNDPQTHKYIGAVSFHSWRGWDTETLQKWADAAGRMNVPLLVGEGSTDAAAWNYPQIFDERTFAMKEIILYTRILNICQPKSILQWQLTSDYSILAGGGVFGNEEEPLHPMQRFWNLKQIAQTPKGVFALPVEADRPEVYPAAFGNRAREDFAVHVVNNGAERKVTITGVPHYVKELRKVVTDEQRGMKETGLIPVENGKAEFTLDKVSFVSLYSAENENWFNPFKHRAAWGSDDDDDEDDED